MSQPEQRLQEAHRARARAEFAEWEEIQRYHAQRIADLETDGTPAMLKRMTANAIMLDIADELKMSEGNAWRIYHHGIDVRSKCPATWDAFRQGTIDAAKTSAIAHALDQLVHDESYASFDAQVPDYAASHTLTQLRSWLKRLVARLETEEFEKRCEKARAEREVEISHGDHGMSYINAYVPTPVAVAVDQRLRAAARALRDDDLEPGEAPRTLMQKKADLLAHWLTNSTGTDTDIDVQIGVSIDADALAGLTDTPALIDDEHPVPATWVAALLADNASFWTQLVTDHESHVLDTTHLGYRPPESLARAIRWRDSECRVAGCRKKARFCDIDHAIPFDAGGATSGTNLQTLCRKHHGVKGHGLLDERRYKKSFTRNPRMPRPSMIEYQFRQIVELSWPDARQPA